MGNVDAVQSNDCDLKNPKEEEEEETEGEEEIVNQVDTSSKSKNVNNESEKGNDKEVENVRSESRRKLVEIITNISIVHPFLQDNFERVLEAYQKNLNSPSDRDELLENEEFVYNSLKILGDFVRAEDLRSTIRVGKGHRIETTIRIFSDLTVLPIEDFVISCSSNSTLLELKTLISKHIGDYPLPLLRLFHNGKEIRSGQSVQDFGFLNNELVIVKRLSMKEMLYDVLGDNLKWLGLTELYTAFQERSYERIIRYSKIVKEMRDEKGKSENTEEEIEGEDDDGDESEESESESEDEEEIDDENVKPNGESDNRKDVREITPFSILSKLIMELFLYLDHVKDEKYEKCLISILLLNENIPEEVLESIRSLEPLDYILRNKSLFLTFYHLKIICSFNSDVFLENEEWLTRFIMKNGMRRILDFLLHKGLDFLNHHFYFETFHLLLLMLRKCYERNEKLFFESCSDVLSKSNLIEFLLEMTYDERLENIRKREKKLTEKGSKTAEKNEEPMKEVIEMVDVMYPLAHAYEVVKNVTEIILFILNKSEDRTCESIIDKLIHHLNMMNENLRNATELKKYELFMLTLFRLFRDVNWKVKSMLLKKHLLREVCNRICLPKYSNSRTMYTLMRTVHGVSIVRSCYKQISLIIRSSRISEYSGLSQYAKKYDHLHILIDEDEEDEENESKDEKKKKKEEIMEIENDDDNEISDFPDFQFRPIIPSEDLRFLIDTSFIVDLSISVRAVTRGYENRNNNDRRNQKLPILERLLHHLCFENLEVSHDISSKILERLPVHDDDQFTNQARGMLGNLFKIFGWIIVLKDKYERDRMEMLCNMFLDHILECTTDNNRRVTLMKTRLVQNLGCKYEPVRTFLCDIGRARMVQICDHWGWVLKLPQRKT